MIDIEGQKRQQPVLVVMALLAALEALAGFSVFVDIIGARIAGILCALLAAIQVGMAYWVRGQVTPLSDPRDNAGRPLVPMAPRVDL